MKIATEIYASKDDDSWSTLGLINAAIARLASFDGEVDWTTLRIETHPQTYRLEPDGTVNPKNRALPEVSYLEFSVEAVPNNG